ncbi:MAG TPA: dihydroorotate dehydrogenase electron transfer subunit [Dehalococcoidales bacterium]|nr:dihydroorotate dehydrogenase electron transfer subunit [Dehalococcoidales bacterium]
MPGVFLLKVQSSKIAAVSKPGQFVMIATDFGQERLLRRPVSLHRVEGDQLHFLLAVVGSGTDWLSRRKTGERLDILGPAGNGFIVNGNSRRLLLVAGGMGIAPLVYLADMAVRNGLAVRLLAGSKSSEWLIPSDSISPGVEYQTATEDGSQGYHGFITSLLEKNTPWADQIFLCGPQPMYQAIVEKADIWLAAKPTQVSLEVRMGCAMGICYSCTIKTLNGLKQVCQDGPVFDFSLVKWDELR